MQLGVDGQLHVCARFALAAVQLAHDPTGGVDLDPLGARLAAQAGFDLGLKSDLADLKAGNAQDGFGICQLAEIIIRHRPDIADHMGEILALGIDAGQADLWRDAGQGGGVDGDLGDIVPADLICQCDRQKGRRAAHLCFGAFDVFGIKRQQAREPFDHRIHIARVFGHDGDAVGLRVLRQDHAVAVIDLATGRGDQANVDPVFLGQQAELIGLIDLQVTHPHGKTTGKGQLQPAEKQRAAAHLAVRGFDVLGVAFHQRLPRASASAGESF